MGNVPKKCGCDKTLDDAARNEMVEASRDDANTMKASLPSRDELQKIDKGQEEADRRRKEAEEAEVRRLQVLREAEEHKASLAKKKREQEDEERRAAEAKAKTEAEKEAALKAEALAKEAAQKAAAEKEAAEKAKAAQDAAQKQKQQGVEVGFGVPGQAGIKTVFFTRRPLGFDFHHEAPITVYKVAPGSHAEEVGVGKGWIVKMIQGQRVDRMNFEAKYEKFVTAVRDLPGGVEVVFELPDKSERAVQFRKRPVGFDFHQESPIKVDSVFPDSHAAQLGIQLGWIVLRINGESMVGKAYEANYQHFVNALKSLPDLPDSK